MSARDEEDPWSDKGDNNNKKFVSRFGEKCRRSQIDALWKVLSRGQEDTTDKSRLRFLHVGNVRFVNERNLERVKASVPYRHTIDWSVHLFSTF